MSASLIARPIPISGESPASVLIRAVEGNGYPNLQALVWALWKNRSGRGWVEASFVDPVRFGQIIDKLGLDMIPEEVPAFTRSGPTSESARLLDGMEIPEKLFRDDGRYFCPDCLSERRYWRKSWTVRPFSVCPEHHKFLLKDCPNCGRRLHLWRAKLAECECGADLRLASSESADPAILRWWLDGHQRSDPCMQAIDEMLLVITDFDGEDDSPQAENRRLGAVHDWFVRCKVASYLQELVVRQAHSTHPRIQMLPFLRSEHEEIRSLAEAILSSWMPRTVWGMPPTDKTMQAREAELALGISRFQLQSFRKCGLIDWDTAGGIRVSFDEVNRLLFSMHAAPDMSAQGEGRKLTESIASMILDVRSGKKPSVGYDVARGLNTLRIAGEHSKKALGAGQNETWLDVGEIAEVLDTYPDAVRFLAKKGWISHRDRDLQNRRRLIARRDDVDRFNRQYVFAGTMARKLGINPTNVAEKLTELGAFPVSGPSVDGALIYLFRRDDAEKIDIGEIQALHRYKTKAGRRSTSEAAAPCQRNSTAMTASEAATRLGIGVQKLLALIGNGILKRIDALDRAVHVERRSVERLRKTLKCKNFVSVEEAARRMNQRASTFERLWIKRGVIRVRDLGLWRLVSLDDLEQLRKQIEGWVTAAEAGKIKSMHRSHFPNMERRNKIRSVRLGKKSGGIRLYRRADIDNV